MAIVNGYVSLPEGTFTIIYMGGQTQAPNIRHVVIIRQHERSLEAAQREVILPRIEAAKTHVVPELLGEESERKNSEEYQ